MPTDTFYGLGYDQFGNNSRLLAEADRLAIEAGEVLRVSGESVCSVCGYAYRLHPEVQGALWAVRGCDGLVKL